MKKSVPISEAESQVMAILWDGSPRSADEVVAALESQQDWQEATVKSLLNRLLKKGAIEAEKDGRRFLYSPVLTREQWVTGESTSMVDRLFGGRVAPLVAHFGQHRKLSKGDLAERKKLIDELSDDE
jgi:predicted transcriptional regulator